MFTFNTTTAPPSFSFFLPAQATFPFTFQECIYPMDIDDDEAEIWLMDIDEDEDESRPWDPMDCNFGSLDIDPMDVNFM
jgi:hypothetical protein